MPKVSAIPGSPQSSTSTVKDSVVVPVDRITAAVPVNLACLLPGVAGQDVPGLLMNSPLMAQARLTNVAVKAGEVTRGASPERAIERLYLTALSRRPTAGELAMLTGYVAKNGNTPATYGDILWAVLNSSEFTLVR